MIVNVEFGGKLRESAVASFSSSCCFSGFICSIWCTRQGEKKKKLVWAEEKPSILSVLKFDSEVQDPGRQKANGGGGQTDTDGQSFNVSVNSPNILRLPTEVSPFTCF